MAGINKNFVVKNGLEVKSNLILADADKNSVGIGTSNINYKLHVRGGIGATDLIVTGIATFPYLSLTGTVAAGSSLGASGQFLTRSGSGVTWSDFPSYRTSQTFTATSSQTTFAFTYNVGFLDVYINGVRLTETEYTAVDGTQVILNQPCFGDETVDFITYGASAPGYAFTGIYGISVAEEGSYVGTPGGILSLNFVGSAVTAVGSGAGVTVYITDTSGGNAISYWEQTASGIHTLSNVGIGTTNPTSTLTVKGNTFTNQLSVSGITTTSNANITEVTLSRHIKSPNVIVAPTPIINKGSGSLSGLGTVSSPNGNQIEIDPSGRFVYVPNYDSNTITQYEINQSTGTLTSIGSTTTGTTPSTLAIDPTGRFLYVSNSGDDNVGQYTIDQSTGVLTSIGTISAGNQPIGAEVDPIGRFLYVANGLSNIISQYSINQTTGALTSIGTIAAGNFPYLLTIDPTGRFLYVTEDNSDRIEQFNINQTTGLLTSSGTTSTSMNPYYVTIDPSGRFLYLGTQDSDILGQYAIDQSTGALTLIGNISTAGSVYGIAIDPTGKYAYVSVENSSTIRQYEINQSTGALTFFGTISCSTDPGRSAVDPTGRFLYVADYLFDVINQYTINNISVGDLRATSIGIGTTNPTSTLTVKGNTSLETLNVSGVSTFSGNLNTNNSNIVLGDGDGGNNKIKFGNGDDFYIYHNSSYGNLLQDVTNVGINIWTANFKVNGQNGIGTQISSSQTGGVELYHYNSGAYSKTFETLGAGATVTGTTFTNQLSVSGASTFGSNVGIGTTNPLYNLTIGDPNQSGVTTSLYVQGNITLNQTANIASQYTSILIGDYVKFNSPLVNSVAIGANAMSATTGTIQNNVAVGYAAGQTLNGDYNTFIGDQSGRNATSANYNTFIGNNSGYNVTTGDNNVIIGNYDGNQSNLDIRTSSNNVVISDGSSNIRFYTNSSGNTGIGTTNPRFALEVGAVGSATTSLWVNGGARIVGTTTTKLLNVSAYPDQNPGLVLEHVYNPPSAAYSRIYDTWSGAEIRFVGADINLDLASIGSLHLGSSNHIISESSGDAEFNNTKGTSKFKRGIIVTGVTTTTNLNVSGVTTSVGGFTSGIGVTDPVQITVSGNVLTFTVAGVGSTSLTLY